MTIKQLHEITPADHKIYIGWNGTTRELDRDSGLELSAYGAYSISSIYAMGENKIEADLAAQPVKEEK